MNKLTAWVVACSIGCSASGSENADVMESEPNDTRSEANRFTPGQSIGGVVEAINEDDLFAVELDAGDVFRIGWQAVGDDEVALGFSGPGDDRDGDIWVQVSNTGTREFFAPRSGTYYVAIGGWNRFSYMAETSVASLQPVESTWPLDETISSGERLSAHAVEVDGELLAGGADSDRAFNPFVYLWDATATEGTLLPTRASTGNSVDLGGATTTSSLVVVADADETLEWQLQLRSTASTWDNPTSLDFGDTHDGEHAEGFVDYFAVAESSTPVRVDVEGDGVFQLIRPFAPTFGGSGYGPSDWDMEARSDQSRAAIEFVPDGNSAFQLRSGEAAGAYQMRVTAADWASTVPELGTSTAMIPMGGYLWYGGAPTETLQVVVADGDVELATDAVLDDGSFSRHPGPGRLAILHDGSTAQIGIRERWFRGVPTQPTAVTVSTIDLGALEYTDYDDVGGPKQIEQLPARITGTAEYDRDAWDIPMQAGKMYVLIADPSEQTGAGVGREDNDGSHPGLSFQSQPVFYNLATANGTWRVYGRGACYVEDSADEESCSEHQYVYRVLEI